MADRTMEQAHFFQGVSGKAYGFHLHLASDLENIAPQPGLYILATSEVRYPGFLVCDHTANLRRDLLLGTLPGLLQLHRRLLVYLQASSDEDRNALEAAVQDITVYYRGLPHYLRARRARQHWHGNSTDIVAMAADD